MYPNHTVPMTTHQSKFGREVQHFLTKSVLIPIADALADKGVTLEMLQEILEMAPASNTSTPRRVVAPVVKAEVPLSERCIYVKRGDKPCENKKEKDKDYCKVCLKRPVIKKKLDGVGEIPL